MAVSLSSTFAILHDNNRLILVPCFVGSPKSPDANLSFIEIESRLREKIRVNAAELRQVTFLGKTEVSFYRKHLFILLV